MASKTGDASLDIAKVGVVVGAAGIVTGQPAVVAGGGTLLSVSGALGLGAGVTQLAGGVAQGIGGGGYKNAIAGAVSIGTGVVLSKALNATIPRGWHGGTLARAQANNRVLGNVIGALQGLAGFLAPTQTTCPK